MARVKRKVDGSGGRFLSRAPSVVVYEKLELGLGRCLSMEVIACASSWSSTKAGATNAALAKLHARLPRNLQSTTIFVSTLGKSQQPYSCIADYGIF